MLLKPTNMYSIIYMTRSGAMAQETISNFVSSTALCMYYQKAHIKIKDNEITQLKEIDELLEFNENDRSKHFFDAFDNLCSRRLHHCVVYSTSMTTINLLFQLMTLTYSLILWSSLFLDSGSISATCKTLRVGMTVRQRSCKMKDTLEDIAEDIVEDTVEDTYPSRVIIEDTTDKSAEDTIVVAPFTEKDSVPVTPKVAKRVTKKDNKKDTDNVSTELGYNRFMIKSVWDYGSIYK